MPSGIFEYPEVKAAHAVSPSDRVNISKADGSLADRRKCLKAFSSITDRTGMRSAE